jgi:RNA 2',3'-cyclic 3'-phosphodiesterase
MPRPNWFFAFPLDGTFVLDLPPTPPPFRRFHPDDVHCTLSFLGGCGEQAAQAALAALEERLRAIRPSPIDVSLGDVVPMGPKPRYSALSALLERGRVETEQCILELRDAVSEAALGRREKRPPQAHVTIARPGRGASELRREEGLKWAKALNLTETTARLDRVALYTWNEDRRERLFRIVTERRFQASLLRSRAR